MKIYFNKSIVFVLFLVNTLFLVAQDKVYIDVKVKMDFPLVKKFAQYNAGVVPYNNFLLDLDKIKEVNAHSMRFDLSIGKGGLSSSPDVVSGSNGVITKYDFSRLDAIAKKLNERNVLPLYSWCYIPLPFQGSSGYKYNNINVNLGNWQTLWQNMHKDFAAHYKSNNIRIGFHELYNEPDIEEFLLKNDFTNYYNQMYHYGVLGIKEGDPDAVVGGPANAIASNTGGFIDYVNLNNLPLDFLSFHSYGDSKSFAFWVNGLNTVRSNLSKYSRFNTTDIFIDEFSWVNIGAGSRFDDYASFNFYPAAALTFDVFNNLLTQPDVTLIHWAQFNNAGQQGMGLIDYLGHRRAMFNAFKIFADMPVERLKLSSTNASCKGMASVDQHKVSVVVWNNKTISDTITVSIKNIPFSTSTFRLYRIDTAHASYYSNLSENLAVVEQKTITADSIVWKGLVPKKAIVYITLNENSSIVDFNPDQYFNFVANDIRVYHYYPKRGSTVTNYAEFDRKTWIAYLGTGDGASGTSHAQTAVEAYHLPHFLDIMVDTSGSMKYMNNNSIAGVRIDYYENGAYTKSVLFHDSIYSPNRTALMPWGTKTQANQVVRVDSLKYFTVDLNKYAPASWDTIQRRAIISFILQNTGNNTRAKFTIRRNINDTLSVRHISFTEKSTLKAFSNKGNTYVYIENMNGVKDFTLYDLNGQTLYNTLNTPNDSIVWNTVDLPEGIYFVKVQSQNQVVSQKIYIGK